MSEPLRILKGIMAPLPESDINTDAIIPSEWLRTATADYGHGLFARERYYEDGTERADFVLNRPPFRRAAILLAGENFGCGSSREAAVWALAGFGIRCVFAPSFANIFYENAFRNALLPGRIDAATADALASEIAEAGQEPAFTIDLPARAIIAPSGTRHTFDVPAQLAEMLIDGSDFIDAAVQSEPEISAYYVAERHRHPWLDRALLESGEDR